MESPCVGSGCTGLSLCSLVREGVVDVVVWLQKCVLTRRRLVTRPLTAELYDPWLDTQRVKLWSGRMLSRIRPAAGCARRGGQQKSKDMVGAQREEEESDDRLVRRECSVASWESGVETGILIYLHL